MRLERVSASLTEVEVDGEIAIYHPVTDAVVLLNPSASAIWRLTADGPVTVEEVVPLLAEAFGIDPAEARRGVAAGIEVLVDEQLLLVDAP
ncbi:PqqD family protein [Jannaschia sp. R86511]|uniref:PqqD family protein n=1 Tax=Jannaschia sp. R86511 TaxID=3093853 RepID=UPI0036D33C98